jgi:pyridinium-3,5-bisthiocarboxylic acid mononucleotide nickel chelatase
MTLAYFDCFSGASGDMILGALVDAGVPIERLRARLAGLRVGGYALSAARTTKGGLAATQVRVELEPGPAPHRHLRHVVEILQSADLPPTVREGAMRVFTRLAEAEARAHGTTVEKVHFHEVGAVDAIVDIVGALLGLDELGVTRVVCSPIPTGSGTVRCAHGVLPVPAPATVALLEGVPLLATDEPGELTTPTGAAILTTVAESYGPLPEMRIASWGYGAGGREGVHRPNLLRVLVGEPAQDSGADEVVILESNLDDVPAETVGFCMGKLLDGGALDVYAVPITMKKSRPGIVLTVLARPADVARLEELLFRETTTFGIRRHRAERQKLERRHETVETGYGPMRIKVGSRGGTIYTAAPEYEDCRQAAEARGVPLKDVLRAAAQAWDARGAADAAHPA